MCIANAPEYVAHVKCGICFWLEVVVWKTRRLSGDRGRVVGVGSNTLFHRAELWPGTHMMVMTGSVPRSEGVQQQHEKW